MQPTWRCVEHVIKLLVRTIEMNPSGKLDMGATDGVVQAHEAAKFLKARSHGQDLAQQVSALDGTDFLEAMDRAQAKMILTMAAIKIQMASRARKARERVAERKRALQAAKEEEHAAPA